MASTICAAVAVSVLAAYPPPFGWFSTWDRRKSVFAFALLFFFSPRYTNHSDTLMAITCLDGTALDERIIKVGIDPGFKQGRQYGRGMSGGQVGGKWAYGFALFC